MLQSILYVYSLDSIFSVRFRRVTQLGPSSVCRMSNAAKYIHRHTHPAPICVAYGFAVWLCILLLLLLASTSPQRRPTQRRLLAVVSFARSWLTFVSVEHYALHFGAEASTNRSLGAVCHPHRGPTFRCIRDRLDHAALWVLYECMVSTSRCVCVLVDALVPERRFAG